MQPLVTALTEAGCTPLLPLVTQVTHATEQTLLNKLDFADPTCANLSPFAHANGGGNPTSIVPALLTAAISAGPTAIRALLLRFRTLSGPFTIRALAALGPHATAEEGAKLAAERARLEGCVAVALARWPADKVEAATKALLDRGASIRLRAVLVTVGADEGLTLLPADKVEAAKKALTNRGASTSASALHSEIGHNAALLRLSEAERHAATFSLGPSASASAIVIAAGSQYVRYLKVLTGMQEDGILYTCNRDLRLGGCLLLESLLHPSGAKTAVPYISPKIKPEVHSNSRGSCASAKSLFIKRDHTLGSVRRPPRMLAILLRQNSVDS